MDAYIIDGVYTPRASVKKGRSGYSAIHPQELLASCFRSLRERQHSFTEVSSAYIGCVSQVNDQGANLARNAVLAANMPQTVAAATLNMCCGSGLETVNLAAASVSAGSERMVIAGGVESMSRVQMASDGGGMDGNNESLRRQLFQVPQGVSADLIATTEGIARNELEQFALASHKKASKARKDGYFQSAFSYVRGANDKALLSEEDHIRDDANLAAMQQLPPSFATVAEQLSRAGVIGKDSPLSKIEHVHTAATASGIADGAGAILLANGNLVKDLHLKPRARIIATRARGSDPISMLTGPADCCAELLKSCAMTVQDIDLWEINEAFAVVPLQTMRRMGISPEKANIAGGAIARGHPLGATGAILLISLLTELEREDLSVGCVVLCVAGGQSVATIIERC